jgi:RNA polymerase sigma-70 factor (ECF subfamily)
VGLADPDTFDTLARSYRRELYVHCYRMLGSVLDAEDIVQETFLRAWRARGTYRHHASPRTWLYRIATHACLTAVSRRARRMLPEDLRAPVEEVAWLEPYPDSLLDGVADTALGPEALFDQREATELAFVAALQHLPPRQRAVLLLRDVLGLSVTEVAEHLGSTAASVSSAHQRARATLAQRWARRVASERSLTPVQRRLLEQYVESWERGDLDALVALLTEDVVLSMPPMAEWFAGRQSVRTFFSWAWSPAGPGPFRLLPVGANAQPAFGLYGRTPDGSGFTPQAIQVLTLADERIARVHGFVKPDLFPVFGLPPRLDG